MFKFQLSRNVQYILVIVYWSNKMAQRKNQYGVLPGWRLNQIITKQGTFQNGLKWINYVLVFQYNIFDLWKEKLRFWSCVVYSAPQRTSYICSYLQLNNSPLKYWVYINSHAWFYLLFSCSYKCPKCAEICFPAQL